MNAFANWLRSDIHFGLVVAGLGVGALVLLRWSVRYLRSCRVPVVLSSRGELAEAPEIETITEDDVAVDAVLVQTCAIDASGLTEPEAACLRRNYRHMSEDDRYELNLTFASIVTPEEVEP